MKTSPKSGWKRGDIWIVEVMHNANNTKHKAILHVGFVEPDGSLGNYSEVWQNSYDSASLASELYYMKTIKKIGTLRN